MKLVQLKLEIADAIRDTDLKVAKLETSLKNYVVERIKLMRQELTDAEVIEQTHDAVGGLRKPHTVTGWLREAGISQRGERSDKGGERKSDEEKAAAHLERMLEAGVAEESVAKFKRAIKALRSTK